MDFLPRSCQPPLLSGTLYFNQQRWRQRRTRKTSWNLKNRLQNSARLQPFSQWPHQPSQLSPALCIRATGLPPGPAFAVCCLVIPRQAALLLGLYHCQGSALGDGHSSGSMIFRGLCSLWELFLTLGCEEGE